MYLLDIRAREGNFIAVSKPERLYFTMLIFLQVHYIKGPFCGEKCRTFDFVRNMYQDRNTVKDLWIRWLQREKLKLFAISGGKFSLTDFNLLVPGLTKIFKSIYRPRERIYEASATGQPSISAEFRRTCYVYTHMLSLQAAWWWQADSSNQNNSRQKLHLSIRHLNEWLARLDLPGLP